MKPYYDHAGITIYHGDCREVMPTIGSQSVDCLWTDPPYGHGNHDGDLNARLNDYRSIENKPIANDGQDEMRQIVDFVLSDAVRILADDYCCCCCCCGGGGPRPTFAWLAQRMDSDGLQFFHSVIWDKRNPGLGWRFRRQHEMIMVAHKKGSRLLWCDEDTAISNVFSEMPPRSRFHPNEKPESLVKRFLSACTKPDSLILDPFMGSGTTLVAAKNLNRRAIGI